MHEYGVTKAILSGLLDQLERESIDRVVRVRFRRSSAFSEDVLRQTFESLRPGTPLENAELVIDVSVLTVHCPDCDQSNVVTSDSLIGHIFVCPHCGRVSEIEGAHDLELVEVIAETSDPVRHTADG